MRDLLNQTSFQFFLATLVMGLLFFFLGFADVFFEGPHGIHFFRQTDSLSFASQYFNKGFEFFQPRVFNLENVDGRAACEFPIMYYLTALLYQFTGNHSFILKSLNLLVVFAGLFAVFKLANRILRDKVYSALIALFFFTSTVFCYYSFNYLPNAPALGFTFLAWYFFYEYISTERIQDGNYSAFFFSLAGLIKVTYLINPLTAICVLIGSKYFKYEQPIDSSKRKRVSIWFIGVLVLPLVWNLYMLYFNKINESTSFLTTALPIWKLSSQEIFEVADYMWNYWYNKYFAHASFHFLVAITLISFALYKRASSILLLHVVVLFFGSLSYAVLFYPKFLDHDYYFLALMPLILFIIINGLKSIQNLTNKKLVHNLLKLSMLVIVLSGINYSQSKLTKRYTRPIDEYERAGLTIQNHLKEINSLEISHDARVIVAPDESPNGALYYLNRMGWNIKADEDLSSKVNQYKAEGAEFLILISNSYSAEEIDSLQLKPLWSNEDLSVYEF